MRIPNLASCASCTERLADCFTTLCTIYADTSRVVKSPRVGRNGIHYAQAFDIVLMCGLTELQAQIRWEEDVSIDIISFTMHH